MEPKIGNNAFRQFIYRFQRQTVKRSFSLAFTAVTADTGKNGYFILVRTCFTVILHLLPAVPRIENLFAEAIYAFNAEIRPMAFRNPGCPDVSAEAVHCFRFDFNSLQKTGVIQGNIPDRNRF